MLNASTSGSGFVAVIGTCDTKNDELVYVRDLVRAAGLDARLVDVSPRGSGFGDVSADDVKNSLSGSKERIAGTEDRGVAVTAMSEALIAWTDANADQIAGMIGLGGSGNTALITPAMRALPIGTPKIMVSTVASGNVAPYVGPNDIAMMYSVVDIAGLNSISRKVLGNAAGMIAGAVGVDIEVVSQDKPALGLTMFGVTTTCVENVISQLEDTHECFVFHATGTGGQTMEKLADSGKLVAMLDLTTTEVADLQMGGVMSAGEDRMGAAIRTGLPYVGSCGALDMVNFGGIDTVPEKYKDRQLFAHNDQITLMRTTPEENTKMGEWIGNKLNQMQGLVRFLIPEGGVSVIDVEGAPFHDPNADAALFEALERTVQQTENRKLIRVPHAINDPEFSDAVVQNFHDIAGG